VQIGANGQLTFDTNHPVYTANSNPYSYFTYPNIPSTAFTPGLGNVFNSIFGVYEDIDPSRCTGDGGVYVGVLGEFPNRAFCVSFYQIPLYANNSIKQTYQIVLYEGSNIIDVYVQDRGCCSVTNAGKGIIGVINSDGSDGIAAPGRNVQDPTWTATNEAWRFVPVSTPVYQLTWYKGAGFDGEIIGNTDSLAVVEGDNIDTVTVRLQFTSCNGSFFDFSDMAIIVWDTEDTVSIADTVCLNTLYTAHGFNIPASDTGAPGVYNFQRRGVSAQSCDTVFDLTLTVLPTEIVQVYDTIYSGDQYYYQGDILIADSTYTYALTGVFGCDSVVLLSLTTLILPVPANLTVVETGNSVVIGWDNLIRQAPQTHVRHANVQTGDIMYAIYKNNQLLVEVEDLYYEDFQVSLGERYCYKVRTIWAENRGDGSDFSDAVCITKTTTAVENLDFDDFVIYPNPVFNGQLTISNVQLNETIQIIDIAGKIVMQNIQLTNNNSVDVSSLANGMYFVKIGNKTARFVKK
jgi:hypothetical protein